MPLFQLVEKKITFRVILSFFLRWSILWPREIFSQYPRKCFKTSEKLNLAVCGSFCGGKTFSLKFVLFHWFDQKKFVSIKSKFSSGFAPFQTCLEKITFWVILSSFRDGHFLLPKGSFISAKMLQNTWSLVLLYIAYFEGGNRFC